MYTIFALASVAGFAVSTKLVLKHHDDCCSWRTERKVNPIAVLGVAFYSCLLSVGTIAFVGGVPLVGTVALALAGAGVGASACLTVVQALGIHRWCPWCLASAVLSLVAALSLLAALGV